MRYLRSKIKAHRGDKLSIDASKATRIMVMPEKEFKKYANHSTFTYYGVTGEKHYEITFPKSGDWEVIVEKGTYHKPIDITAKLDLKRADPDEGRKQRTLHTSMAAADAEADAASPAEE